MGILAHVHTVVAALLVRGEFPLPQTIDLELADPSYTALLQDGVWTAGAGQR